jgi:hypothetical protein
MAGPWKGDESVRRQFVEFGWANIMKTINLKWACTRLVFIAFAVPAQAQTNEHPSHIPTRQEPNSPFGTQWAKPSGTTGSYIYDDPRLRGPKDPHARHDTRCPTPLLYDPVRGQCP